MGYRIEKIGRKYVVRGTTTGRMYGMHATVEGAKLIIEKLKKQRGNKTT